MIAFYLLVEFIKFIVDFVEFGVGCIFVIVVALIISAILRAITRK